MFIKSSTKGNLKEREGPVYQHQERRLLQAEWEVSHREPSRSDRDVSISSTPWTQVVRTVLFPTPLTPGPGYWFLQITSNQLPALSEQYSQFLKKRVTFYLYAFHSVTLLKYIWILSEHRREWEHRNLCSWRNCRESQVSSGCFKITITAATKTILKMKIKYSG